MNLVTVQSLIEPFLDTNWTATDIAWQNIRFDEPVNSAWIKVEIKPGPAEVSSFGVSGKNRQFGNVWINLFYPLDEPLPTLWGYVDLLKETLNRKSFSGGLQFEAPQIMDIGARPKDKWYQVSIRFPFYFFE